MPQFVLRNKKWWSSAVDLGQFVGLNEQFHRVAQGLLDLEYAPGLVLECDSNLVIPASLWSLIQLTETEEGYMVYNMAPEELGEEVWNQARYITASFYGADENPLAFVQYQREIPESCVFFLADNVGTPLQKEAIQSIMRTRHEDMEVVKRQAPLHVPYYYRRDSADNVVPIPVPENNANG